MTITGQEIFDALRHDASFIGEVPAEARAVYAELCALLSERFVDLEKQPLTADTYVSAKIIVLTLLTDEEWTAKLLAAYSDDLFGAFSREMVIGLTVSKLTDLLTQLRSWEGKMTEMLAQYGWTEADFLSDKNGGRLFPGTMVIWNRGGFTVGDLLRMQPVALFRNL